MFDFYLSCAVIGRTLATIAELCFISQISILINELSEDVLNFSSLGLKLNRFCAYLIFVLILIAETISWIGILTKNQLFNCGEESLWMISILIALICFMNIFINRKKNSNNVYLNLFFFLFFLVGTMFVLYMFLVDILMYYKRWKLSEDKNMKYLGIIEGYYDASYCHELTKNYSEWKEDIMWMTPYFSFCVWASISFITLIPNNYLEKEEKTE